MDKQQEDKTAKLLMALKQLTSEFKSLYEVKPSEDDQRLNKKFRDMAMK